MSLRVFLAEEKKAFFGTVALESVQILVKFLNLAEAAEGSFLQSDSTQRPQI
jgi:hypothetical protein